MAVRLVGSQVEHAGVVSSMVRLGQQIREAAEEVAAHVIDVAQRLDRERRGAPDVLGRCDHLQALKAVEQIVRGGVLPPADRRQLLERLRAIVPAG